MKPQDLRRFALFAEIDEAILPEIAGILVEKKLANGDRIFSEGDSGDAIYCIAKGMVRIDKRIASESTEKRTLSILGAGECFGEMAFFDQNPRSASTTAYGEATIYSLSKESLRSLLQEDAALANQFLLAVVKVFTERIRNLNASVIVYHEIGRAIGAADSLQGLLTVVLKQLQAATASSYGLILLKQEFSNRLDLKCSLGISISEPQEKLLTHGKGLCRWVTAKKRSLLMHDFENDRENEHSDKIGFETPSMIWAPFILQNEVFGMIVLGNSTIGQFSLNELNLSEGVALQTAQAILEFRRREEENQRQKLGRQYVKF